MQGHYGEIGSRLGHATTSSPFARPHPPRFRPQAHPRDVAMNHDRKSHGDDGRDRGRSDRRPRGPRLHARSRSSSPVPHRAPGFRDRHYTRDDDNVDRRPDSHAKPQSSSARHRESSREAAHGRERRDSLIEAPGGPRTTDRRAKGEHHHEALQLRYEGDHRSEHGPAKRARGAPDSPPLPSKRRRSLSPLHPPSAKSSSTSRRERGRDRSHTRGEGRRPKRSGHSRHDHPPSPSRPRSPSPYEGRPHHPSEPRAQRPDLFESHQSRTRDWSPHPPPARGADLERRDSISHPSRPRPLAPLHPHEESHPRGRSRSPRPNSRRSSFSRTHSPGRPHPVPSDRGSLSRRSSPPNQSSKPSRAPRSPRGGPGAPPPSGPRKKGKRRDESHLSGRGKPSSGANSVEVNMSRRGDYRGSFSAPTGPASQSRHYNDHRYNQSPPHVTPGSSYHGSPTAQSPRGGNGRGNWNSHNQYSPHNQHPSHHSQNNHGPSNGPHGQFSQNQSPPHAPTGPSQSFAQGRGFSRGGFRGGNANSTRGGSRGGGNSKGTPFGAPTGPAATRGQFNRSGDNTPQHNSPPYAASNYSDAATAKDDAGDETPFRPSTEHQAEDATSDKHDDEQMPPPNRAPPTGPASGSSAGPKFSFAFKATSKVPVAAPKPEISQKFSAAPPKRDPQPVDDRSNRERDLPRGTPTEPASSRARSDHHHNRNHPPEPPAPRTRKVKKIQTRLKTKPRLPDDLATSDSVYFRKPGNESVVGSGTYGKVFKGLHVYTKKLVALKKIRMEGERDGFPVTAVREIKLLQSLKHENIVNLQEVMVEKNDCFMVFEYLSHDLTGILNHPSFKLDSAQKKHLAKQLFEGLDYLHTRGVLHRDIKAANILVSSDGILKLADFGLARFYAKRHQYDYTNRVITIWYRSPELLLGETQYGAAVDVWSAACVMIEIFTRHAIFPGDGSEISQLEKIYAILGTPNNVDWPDLVKMDWFELLRPGYRKPNIFAEKYKDKMSAAGFDLLAAMFQYDPTKRPSAAEVLEHPYFVTEQPPARQAIELANLEGDWHEFESKALRREKEKQERDAKRAAASKDGGSTQRDKDQEKKRPGSTHETQREAKRAHIEGRSGPVSKPSDSATAE